MKFSTVLVLAAVTCLMPVAVSADTEVTTITIPVVKCSAPVKSIAIISLECTAASCQPNGGGSDPRGGIQALAAMFSGQGGVQTLGKGMGSMFANALKETGCFKLIDLEQVKKVKAMLEASGQTVTPPQIDLMVSGQIPSVELTKSGGALAGGFIPVVGLFSRHKEEAAITMDISVMNPSTMEVGASQSFSAKSDKVSWGFGGGAGVVGGGWSVSKSMALDAVAREAVVNAANFVAETYAKDRIVSRPNKEGKQEPVAGTAPATSVVTTPVAAPVEASAAQ